MQNSNCRLLKKTQRQGARRSMSGGVLFLYVDAKSVECNEAYESFSAACLLALPGRLERLVYDINDPLHFLPFGSAGIEVFNPFKSPAQERQIIFRNVDTQRVGGIFRVEHIL